ncbi:maleylpyruvate isomerase N-terminal domain-containing protein [Pseudofrankia saprophytica]|nr:maleylpyruvate isomerase N-terminal domain-containing protein [Pseudofrankia saprophytica]
MAELNSVRADFHELVATIREKDWERRPPGSEWTVRQIMYHLAMGQELFASGLGGARRSLSFTPPVTVGNRINNVMTVWGARRADGASIRRKFDRGHHRLASILSTVQAEEWGNRGVQNFRGRETVESTYGVVRAHFEEHAADVRVVLAEH